MDELTLLPGSQPFYFPGGEGIGCLLIHGFTGAPFEMRWLGEHLCAQGWTAYGPRLAGHATSPGNLARVHWEEWAADVLAAYALLRERCDKLFVCGLSMGGSLTLWLAAHRPVDGLITLAAPLTYEHPLVPLLPLISPFVKTYPKRHDEAERAATDARIRAEQRRRGQPETGPISYDGWVVPAVRQFLGLLADVRATAPRITAPALLVHSRADETVPFDNMERIRAAIGSEEIHTLALEQSGHVVTTDIEREQVFAAVTDFIAAHG
jgi:carboxylesterase